MSDLKKRSFPSGRARLWKPARTETPAFTLVELIVVITILAVLATVGFLALQGYTKDASKSAVRANLKTLAQAVSSESAQNGNSPRRYVIYSSGLVLSGARFSGSALVPGPYGTPGTNYSAGTPDFAALRADPSKFRNPDGTPFSIGALDWTETLSSGKTRSRSFFQLAGFPESGTSASGTMAVEGTYPVATTRVTAGLVASSSGSSVAAIDGLAPGVSNATKYPGCDTDDIALDNGQVWAACNAGATIAFTGQTYPASTSWRTAGEKAWMGGLYQWGRNDDPSTNAFTDTLAATGTLAWGVGHSNFIRIPVGADWIAYWNDNLWGGSGTTLSSGTYGERSAPEQAAMKGPCVSGYHVPTIKEWCDAIVSVSSNINCSSGSWLNETTTGLFYNTLKLSLSGHRSRETANTFFQGAYGRYWTSSPGSTWWAKALDFSSTQQIRVSWEDNRGQAFSVRCLKN